MTHVKSRAAVVALAALCASLFLGAPAQATTGLSAEAQYLFDGTNDYRASKGKEPLLNDAELNAVAQAYAEQMAAKAESSGVSNAFHHNPNLSSQVPGGWTYLGENIAWNTYNLYAGYDPVAKMMKQWKESPGHAKNMANSHYTHMGIGYYADDTGAWGVQVFVQYPPNTALEGGGEFFKGEQRVIALDVDPAGSGAGELWIKKNGNAWKRTHATVRFTDGSGSRMVKPGANTTQYKVRVERRILQRGYV